jgi:hypothetical protein
MKHPVLYSLCAAFACSTAFAELSRVSVKGNQFVTADGRPIVFRGLAASDADKLERNAQWNKGYFEQAKAWGANVIRLPIHPAAWRIRGKDAYAKLLDQGVAWASEVGLYVVMDWHVIGNIETQRFLPGSSELYPTKLYDTTKEETLDFWRFMARRYRGNNTVAFFELFNEPATGGNMGECPWAVWKGFIESVIGAIRAEGGTAVPLVAGFNYGYDLTPVANSPIAAEGIGYVAHPYPMKREKPWPEKWTQDWGFVAEKYPAFATELGFCYADDKGAHIPVISDESYVDAITAYSAEKGISFAVWCFDPHWSPTLIKDWSFAPTKQGEFFKKAMLQTAQPKGQ